MWFGFCFLVEVWTISHEGWRESNPSAIYPTWTWETLSNVSLTYTGNFSLNYLLKHAQVILLGRNLRGRQQTYSATKTWHLPSHMITFIRWISLDSCGWPIIYLINPPASASWLRDLQICITMPGLHFWLQFGGLKACVNVSGSGLKLIDVSSPSSHIFLNTKFSPIIHTVISLMCFENQPACQPICKCMWFGNKPKRKSVPSCGFHSEMGL